jgi:hypothetical protein
MLGAIQTARRTAGWAVRLMFGKIQRLDRPPASAIPMRSVDGLTTACHAPLDVPPAPTVTIGKRRPVRLPVAS